MEFIVRELQELDREKLIDLINEYVGEYVKKEHCLPAHFDPKIGEVYWETITKNRDDSVAVVAMAGDDMIGFCLGDVHHHVELEKVYFDGDRYGELWDIYTKPDWQGKGVGGKMIAIAEEEFLKKGCVNVLLNSVGVENYGAIKLYEKLGYKPYTLKYFKPLASSSYD